jgi:hypothetical protein
VEMMDNYGFKLVTKDEGRQMGLPGATGLFSDLYDDMMSEIKRNPKAGVDYKNASFMTTAEKSVSFLNRYFVFRKVMSVDAAKKEKLFLQGSSDIGIDEDIAVELEKVVKKRPAIRGEIKKTKIRVRLQKPSGSVFSEVTQEEPDTKKGRFEEDE